MNQMQSSGKYLHVVSVFPALTETFVLREIRKLRELGCNVIIAPLRPTGATPAALDFDDLKACRVSSPRIVSLDTALGACYFCCLDPKLTWSYFRLVLLTFPDLRGLAKIAYILLMSMKLSYKLRHAGISHVRGHHLHSEALAAMFISGFLRLPYSFTCHTAKGYYPCATLQNVVRRADFIVATSDKAREFLYSLGAGSTQVHLVRNAVMVKELLRRKSQAAGAVPIILGIGRLDYKKGFHILLSACHILRRSGVRFRCVIVGDGHERKSLLAIRRRLGLEETVEMVGSLGFSEVSRWLDQAAMLAVPSVVAEDGSTDGIPTVIIEAFAKGVPVVGTHTAAIPEIITSGVNGFLVAPNSPEELAVRLAELLEKQDLRDQFSIEGRHVVERDYNLEENARVLADLLIRSVEKAKAIEGRSATLQGASQSWASSIKE